MTDFALRAMKVTARSLGKAMSTMVVQERHLWLNLAEMKDVDKPSSSQWYSSRPRRSSTSCPGVTHRPPLPPGPGLSLPIAVGDLLCPPELLHPRLNRPKSSSRSTKRPRRGQPEDVGVCSFSGDGENSAAPSPGGGPGGESYVFFCFFSETFPTFSKKEQFPFPPGSQVHGTTVCDALLSHSRPRSILPAAKRVRFGDAVLPHAPLASPIGAPGSSTRMPQNAPRHLLYHPAILHFAAPPQVR